ncbi:SDR family oxidoreductase [Nocardioides coralli]|uniref:SDR family oxidoreductase n=1 Tax=Nocardioides coralli TaxID=2872154 RepID=UPI001CA45C6E|nr:SDR family oxidoreductase [Nocardioides coralli]QZY30618.1 SDR family oxidoreductase [Nocardioides coralli]
MTRPVVLVAGAGPGVSGSLARTYAQDGHDVGLLGADEEVLATLAAELGERGAVVEHVVADLTDQTATRAAVTRIGERFGHLEVLHFNPSAYRERGPLELTVAELLEDVTLGVGALLTVLQAARPFLTAGSRVTATGSMAADRPDHRVASLGVQKAGLQNLVRSIDAALEPDGIRAVSVTVRGSLSREGAFTPDRVAEALHAAAHQDPAAWRSELAYEG